MYLDFQLCSLTELKEHSREICYVKHTFVSDFVAMMITMVILMMMMVIMDNYCHPLGQCPCQTCGFVMMVNW